MLNFKENDLTSEFYSEVILSHQGGLKVVKLDSGFYFAGMRLIWLLP